MRTLVSENKPRWSKPVQFAIMGLTALALSVTGLAAPTAKAVTCPGSMSPVAGLVGVCEQVFTASGTFTMPTDATYVEAFILGGGGGGGAGRRGDFSNQGAGGGGGGGYYVIANAPTGTSATISVTVGSGGSAGTAGGGNGGAGGDSSVNWGPTSVSAAGGSGGIGGGGGGGVNGGNGGDNGPAGDRRLGGLGATGGAGPNGGGGGAGVGSAGGNGNPDGGDGAPGGPGGNGARPDASQVLFGNLPGTYGGGGGGGAGSTGGGGPAGTGGGGGGGSGSPGTGSSGTPNSGGGGGGGSGVGAVGGTGGSGLVIFRASFGEVPVPAIPQARDEPSPVLQQVGRPSGKRCEDLVTSDLDWGGVSSDGWTESWAEWAVPVTGGPVCTRELFYDSQRSRWSVRR